MTGALSAYAEAGPSLFLFHGQAPPWGGLGGHEVS